jgi:acetoin utilization deacetylase AcuC-like enzyme
MRRRRASDLMWWWQRWRARSRLGSTLGLWYHRDYAAPEIPAERRVANLQTDRAERALARLEYLRIVSRDDVQAPPLASLADLERVHPRSYLERVADPNVLGSIFGLEADMVDVDALLTAQRRAVGGTVAAAQAALKGSRRIVFNLGGGFHHAAPESGAGFCVFNDVAVAIAGLRAAGFNEPIAIVDLDFHQGDGNLIAFEHDASVLVYSIHGSSWTERGSARSRNFLLPAGTEDAEYLRCLDESLWAALLEHNTRLIFYVAGVDVLAGDQLGDFALSARGVLARDRRVVEAALALDAPLVITLAGGYSAGAWQCTSNLIRWVLTGITRVDRDPFAKLRYRYEQVARGLDPWELQRDDGDVRFSESDLLPDLGRRPRRLLLDFYSRHGVELVLERYGILPKIRAMGFDDLHVVVNPEDPTAQVIRVFGRRDSEPAAPPLLLLEVVLSRRMLKAPADFEEPGAILGVLRIEWLLLQDPTRRFTSTRPRLPGQEHPGLGIAHDVHELLVRMARRLRLEAIVHCPAHYHNAVVATREYHFIDPVLEGRFWALRRVLGKVPLPLATAYVDEERLSLSDGTKLVWEPGEVLLPVSYRLRQYFASRHYAKTRDAARDALIAAGLHVTRVEARIKENS